MVRYAKLIDQFRVFPRLLMLAVYIFSFAYIYYVTEYYLAATDKSTELTAFVSVTIPALAGIVTNLTNNYFKTGIKWDVH